MKAINKTIIYFFIAAVLSSCASSNGDYDATGSFEAVERTISSEATGKILKLDIEEGQKLSRGQIIGSIDVSILQKQWEEAKSTVDAINDKTDNSSANINVLKTRLKTQEAQTFSIQQKLTNLEKEIKRFENLVEANAVPKKQLDDLVGQSLVLGKQLESAKAQTEVIKAEIKATKENTEIHNRAILSAIKPGNKKVELIQEKIKNATIVNSIQGTITSKLAYDGEFTSIGKPLYKIASLSDIFLRAYITANQISKIKLNDEVIVRTDDGNNGFKETKGRIILISSKSEFTPKTIQTKDERANLVYAIKVKVNNANGDYKIGMYGEIKFLE